MKKIIIILVVSVFFSCNKSNEIELISHNHTEDANLSLSLFNTQNEDLLNPENPNHLDVFKIKLYNEINGIKQVVYNVKYDNQETLAFISMIVYT